MPLSAGRSRRVALIGETIDQVRAVMVEGESGLLATSPPDRRPELKISQNRLVWPNGAEAMLVSAANPEALRGPQFDCAWADGIRRPVAGPERREFSGAGVCTRRVGDRAIPRRGSDRTRRVSADGDPVSR